MHADTKRILVIVALSFLIATGISTVMSACFISKSGWPLIPIVIGGVACLLLFGTTMAEDAIDDDSMPSYLRDGSDDAADIDMEVGWFIFGSLVVGVFASPLILAQSGVLVLKTAWMSAVGAWCTVAVVGISAVLLLKGQ